MRASSARRNRPQRYTARLLIHLDAEAQATFETLCTAVGRLPPHVLRQVIAWGLRQEEGWRVDRRRVEHPADTLVVRLEPEVRTRVHGAAHAAGGDASTWVCSTLHRVTLEDLPEPWQTGEPAPRSHDSRYYDRRFMLRLDQHTSATLKDFSEHFKKPAAEIIRHLVAQATPEDFPPDWRLAAEQRRHREGHRAQASQARRPSP